MILIQVKKEQEYVYERSIIKYNPVLQASTCVN